MEAAEAKAAAAGETTAAKVAAGEAAAGEAATGGSAAELKTDVSDAIQMLRFGTLTDTDHS